MSTAMSSTIVSTPEALALTSCVISIGNFDGVHLGHQMLLERMKELASELDVPCVIISFHPPAKAVFLGEKYLTNRGEKLSRFKTFHPDAIVMIPFSLEYAKTDKQVFLEALRHLNPRSIIVGEDFRFGHKRSGGLDDLSHVTEKLEVFGMKHLGDTVIKSSLIRDVLAQAEVEQAAQLLGYSYQASGVVIEGDKRGKTIGFPTANLDISEAKALPLGVFAVKVKTQIESYLGMANVGARPSFPDGAPKLEVHLFDFDDDLYGQSLTVSFEHFIRKQVIFNGLDEVKAQLAQDEEMAREKLS